MKTYTERTVCIGYCAVDSGQILITDPGYLDGWGKQGFGEAHIGHYSYGGACATTLAAHKHPNGQLEFASGTAGAGVVSTTGLGDGYYPVYATIRDIDGWGERVTKLEIVFFDGDGEDDDEA